MIQCARCGANNQATSKYCLSCGAPLPAAAAAPPPGFGPPPGGQPPAAPPQAAPPPNFGPPPGPTGPAAWNPPGYGPPPGHSPGQGPSPGFGPPPAGPTPPPEERFRIGSPDGLNPFGATMTPGGAPGPAFGAPQPGPSPAPQQGYPGAPSPGSPAPQYGSPGGAPPGPPPWAAGGNVGPAAAPPQPPRHPLDAYAPVVPPPLRDEYDAGRPPPFPGAPQYGSPQPDPGLASSPPAANRMGAGPSRPPAAGRDPEHVEPSAPRALAGFLVSYDQSDIGVFWPIYQGQNVVGRKAAAPGLDIEIDHPTTSSRHAVLFASARPARLKVEDSGSTNGTYLGDQPLERSRKHELRDGDLVRFGGFSAIVKLV